MYRNKHLDVKRYAVAMGRLTDGQQTAEAARLDDGLRDEVVNLITRPAVQLARLGGLLLVR